MVLTLNEKQKQFLFQRGYIDAKCLDALTYNGWEKYFIDNFTWKLDLSFNKHYLNDLYLIDNDSNKVSYEVMCNFHEFENDLGILLNL